MFKIQSQDEVKILLGKDRGRTGKVVRVLTKTGQVIVEGVNLFKRSLRADALKRQGNREAKGQIIEIVKPMDISNVALICQNCKMPARVGFEVKNDQKVRICKKCKKEIETKRGKK